MEHDVVLSDKVYEACFGVFPPFLPRVGQQFLGVRDVADRCVKPYVEHLAFGSLYRNGDTPVEVTAYGTRLKSHVEPRLALAVHVGAPFLVVFQNPLAQPCLVLVERQVPVLGFLHHRLASADGTLRVDKFGRRERGTALLALVAVSALGVATRTFARDVAVGKESLCFLVVVLHRGLFYELAFVVKGTKECRCRVVVHLRSGTPVHIERNAELLERVADERVIAVHDVLRRASFLLGADGDGHAVLVRASDE